MRSKRAPAKSTVVCPTPRPRVYDLYWQFAARRQEAFYARFQGLPQPWSDDPILQTYKFCNVYRAADRVSQYMIREVACRPSPADRADRLFQIIAFRTFSKIETWDGVIARLGQPPTIEDLRSGSFEAALTDVRAELGGLYTGAFILCATKAFGFSEKHRNHVALFRSMFLKHGLADTLANAPSLEAVVRALEVFPLTGPFMAYQIAIDLNYSDLFPFDEDDYTQAGPGALRGLNKVFTDLGTYSRADAIQSMVDVQEREFSRRGLQFGGLWGRPMHAIDCQGLFCEVDKYCREAVPQLVSNRTRIKTRFSPSNDPLAYTFPPKWKLVVPLAAVR